MSTRELMGHEDAALADKLNKLFAVKHKASEPPLSNTAAAEGIDRKTGVAVAADDLRDLRDGKKRSAPTAQLQAVAEFFGVSPSYLIEPGIHAQLDDTLDLLVSMRDAGVRPENLPLNSSQIPTKTLKAIVDKIGEAKRAGEQDRTM